MSKYNNVEPAIGSIVTIKKDLIVGDTNAGYCVTDRMLQHMGKQFKITRIDTTHFGEISYRLNIPDMPGYGWAKKWIQA